MIIVKFNGGLGNQMFQYAMYLSLQKRYPGVRIVGDCLAYKINRIHNGFELPFIYQCAPEDFFITSNSKHSPYGKYIFALASKITTAYFTCKFFRKNEYVKDNGKFNTVLLNLDKSKNYYIDGTWGNSKYFEAYRQELLAAFTLRQSATSLDRQLSKAITSTPGSVSIHIRRGDYLASDSIFRSLTDTDYYRNAVAYISARIKNPYLFIFSDDIAWCKDNLDFIDGLGHCYVEGNHGANSYKDIHLMSLCNNNIIANSTFSWWAGWLNSYNDKLVLTPGEIFNNANRNNVIVNEFNPPSWIKVNM